MKKKAIILIILLICLLGLTWTIVKNNIVKQADNVVISTLELSSIDDGIYMGEYILSPVKVIVQVQIKNHKIHEIKILEHQNGFGEKAEIINDRVMEKQTLEVDVVSGATVSSKVMLKAIENALSK
ncbi:FMN-binding protein [Irregularibacter muris]|uniref:FMN-binding protein n=1 Tax=Irregularibacter muris TaxID=1796619 RepID=A0AAE3HDQ7_9FIRM|nr:FMN-binding protein [Irregularibacter muris]MCR1897459.1 FMN-binding protein [Irregularibacter muris]